MPNTQLDHTYYYCFDHNAGFYRPCSIKTKTLQDVGKSNAIDEALMLKGVDFVDVPGEPYVEQVLPLETLLPSWLN